MNYTSINQSKKLLKLGLNPESADMASCGDNVIVTPYLEAKKSFLVNFAKEDSLSPCWSVGALLEVLKTRKDCNFLTLHSSRSLKWILNTSYYKLANWREKETIGNTQIEAVYNMVVWLLENGHLKK